MTAPESPTPRSVSATLVAADFRAYRDGRDEGFQVEWTQGEGSPVRVDFEAVTNDTRDLAMEIMTVVLTRKGWSVTGDSRSYLTVKER